MVKAAMREPSNTDKASLRMQFACLYGLIVIWAVELYWVQKWTFIGVHPAGPTFDFFAPKIRMLLNGLGIAVLCLTFRSWRLIPWLLFSFGFSLLVISYASYFQRALSFMTVLGSWREGLAVGGHVTAWIPPVAFCTLATLLATKCMLTWIARDLRLPSRRRWSIAGILLSAYIIIYLFTLFVDPLDQIMRKRGVARLGIIRGYTGPWIAEWYYLNDKELLANAIANAKNTSDQLTPQEAPLMIHDKLAIIQVESLEYNVIDYKYHDREVTPFINQLMRRSLFYHARCYHVLGSADADFTMLVGGEPAMNALNYSIPNHPYNTALPWHLKRYGYRSSALHGNNGTFYRRRSAFERMGFEKLYFREELEKLGGFKVDAIGLRDRDVLNFSATELRNATSPTCHFLITLTSHSPYTFLEPEEDLFIPDPQTATERYFNHIHYVDQCLKDYIDQLGSGVTVVIYSDHATEVSGHGFKNSREANGEFVPVFIYDTDQDLAPLQQTRSTIALSGELSMLDISSFLRNRVEASHEAGTTVQEAPPEDTPPSLPDSPPAPSVIPQQPADAAAPT